MRSGPARLGAASRGRVLIVLILATFVACSAVAAELSVTATGRAQGRAGVITLAARQSSLVERYVNAVLLARAGQRTMPPRPPGSSSGPRGRCWTAASRRPSPATTTAAGCRARAIRWCACSWARRYG